MSVIRDNALYPGRWPGLTLEYGFRAMDGNGGKLGNAGPTAVNWEFHEGQYVEFAASGSMDFDIADIDTYTESQWEEIVMHEIGHTIGMGTLWDNRFVNCVTHEYLGNPITGVNRARAMYLSMGGQLTDAPNGNVPPISPDCDHWDENKLDAELMTPYYDTSAPLSSMTAAAMEDLNYIVDYAYVQHFTMVRLLSDGTPAKKFNYPKIERLEPHRQIPRLVRVHNFKHVHEDHPNWGPQAGPQAGPHA